MRLLETATSGCTQTPLYLHLLALLQLSLFGTAESCSIFVGHFIPTTHNQNKLNCLLGNFTNK